MTQQRLPKYKAEAFASVLVQSFPVLQESFPHLRPQDLDVVEITWEVPTKTFLLSLLSSKEEHCYAQITYHSLRGLKEVVFMDKEGVPFSPEPDLVDIALFARKTFFERVQELAFASKSKTPFSPKGNPDYFVLTYFFRQNRVLLFLKGTGDVREEYVSLVHEELAQVRFRRPSTYMGNPSLLPRETYEHMNTIMAYLDKVFKSRLTTYKPNSIIKGEITLLLKRATDYQDYNTDNYFEGTLEPSQQILIRVKLGGVSHYLDLHDYALYFRTTLISKEAKDLFNSISQLLSSAVYHEDKTGYYAVHSLKFTPLKTNFELVKVQPSGKMVKGYIR